MSANAVFVLPDDVLVFPVSELDSAVQSQTGSNPHDFVVTRPNARQSSIVLDQKGAALIESFRKAKTVIDAVLDFSTIRGLDPHQVLEGAFPLVHQLVASNILVPAASQQAQRIAPTLDPGAAFGIWTVE